MIQQGSIVSIHYTLTIDGEVVDSSAGSEPLKFEFGSGTIIVGLEEKLANKKTGDRFDAIIPPEKAYGFRNPQAVQAVPKSAFGDQINQFQVGGVINGEMQGQPFQAQITQITDSDVTLDLNHPLADKTLHFSVEIVAVG